MLLKIYLWGCIIFLVRAYFIAEELDENMQAPILMLTSVIFTLIWPIVLGKTIYDVFIKRG